MNYLGELALLKRERNAWAELSRVNRDQLDQFRKQLRTTCEMKLAALRDEYGFTPDLNLDDVDSEGWGDAKQRGYGAYFAYLRILEML